jgi:hypothetical protein
LRRMMPIRTHAPNVGGSGSYHIYDKFVASASTTIYIQPRKFMK